MEVEIYKIKYKIPENENNIKILGENFVINNKNKSNFIINNKKGKIKSILPIKILKQNKLKIVLSKNVYNISYMFKDCELLESLSNEIYQNINANLNNEDDRQLIDDEHKNLN